MLSATEDRVFVRDLGLGIAALVCSALLVLLAFIVYASARMPEGANTSHSKRITGAQLTARMGTARADGEAIVVSGLKTLNRQKHALVSHRLSFRADSYPYLNFSFEGLNTGQDLNFIWRTARYPRQLFTIPMPRRFGESTTFNLTHHPEWQGTITEVGVHLQGDLREEPFVIPDLLFKPHGWRNLLSATWSEWTGFRGWTGKSINFLKGTPGLIDQETVSPTLAMAVWAGSALLILYIIGRITSHHRTISYAIAIMVPWILVDQLWQRDLNTQLEETRHLFSGKSMHERHLADVDSHIYQYVKRLKAEVLPSNDQRIFILHESSDLNYDRLKVQYYLLPHNVFNYGRIPDKRVSRPGDYILWLGQIPGLDYDSETNRLTWGKNKKLRVELVDQGELGSLYRVKGRKRGKAGPRNQGAADD